MIREFLFSVARRIDSAIEKRPYLQFRKSDDEFTAVGIAVAIASIIAFVIIMAHGN